LSTLSIIGARQRCRRLEGKELTVPVYGRTPVCGWFWRGGDVEKLRKALEKKAMGFRLRKQKPAELVNKF
jgi:hypothetical protein